MLYHSLRQSRQAAFKVAMGLLYFHAATIVSGPLPAAAQTSPSATSSRDDTTTLRFQPAGVQRWEFGVRIRATGRTTGIVASLPVPMDWPEQKVSVASEQISRNARVRYKTLDEGVKQMIVSIPRLDTNETATALVTFEIEKQHILAPFRPDQLRIPARPDRSLREFLGESPYIETRDLRIQGLSRDLFKNAAGNDWQKVEALFDWVRKHVEYKFDEQIKGARKALDDGVGDCEELTSLFVAMCRNNGIPARCVWIPAHTYPEFYLENEAGEGTWFPCQAAGERSFGAMPEVKPVLQKGDNFRIPGQRERTRYVAQTLSARHAAAPPQIEWVMKPIP